MQCTHMYMHNKNMYVNTVVDKLCVWTNYITSSSFIQYSLAGPQ